MLLRKPLPLACLLLVAAAVPLILGRPAGADTRPDFTGLWTLDEEASDDPVDKWREAMDADERRGSRRRDRRPGSLGSPTLEGRDRLSSGPERPEDRLRALSVGLEELNIDHEGELLKVRLKDGRERLLYTDGRDLSQELENGLLDARASWKKGKIVVKGESARGERQTEVFELSDDGQQLWLTVTLAGRGARAPAVTFRRVYRGVDFDLFG